MRDPYVHCYWTGRFHAYDHNVDVDRLLTMIEDGADMRDVTKGAASDALERELDGAHRDAWLRDNREEVKELGGDQVRAWNQYKLGRRDALAHELEDDILALLADEPDDEDDEGEPDEDDGEPEEDEDEEDDCGDEEEEEEDDGGEARAH